MKFYFREIIYKYDSEKNKIEDVLFRNPKASIKWEDSHKSLRMQYKYSFFNGNSELDRGVSSSFNTVRELYYRSANKIISYTNQQINYKNFPFSLQNIEEISVFKHKKLKFNKIWKGIF